MDLIYPISYLASLGGLATWFIVQGNKSLSRTASAIFLVGFLTYLVALTFGSADVNYKFFVLFRDLIVLGVVSQLFNLFQKNKLLTLILATVVIVVLYFSYFNVLTLTFPQVNTESIDENAEFLVQVETLSEQEIDIFESKNQCEFVPAFIVASTELTTLDDFFVVNDLGNTTSSRKKLYDKLERTNGITWVEPNETIQLNLPETTSSPVSGRGNHAFNDPGLNQQWGFDLMNVEHLHKLMLASGISPRKKANIAIIDSGVDAKHEDLRDHYVSFKKDYDTDPHRHGTHCAGIAAAVSNNGLGIASYTPGNAFVSITGYKVMNAFGIGTQQQVIQGMIDAVDNGADVISMSLGGPTQRKKEKAYKAAVDYARKHNAIVVVAAGNNNQSAKSISPANVEGVIAVTAVNPSNTKAFFSNTVSDIGMGIAAPGQDIYSTIPGNKYATLSGTSMAAPYVSGLIAVLRSIDPNLNTDQVYHLLKKTGIATENGHQTGPLIQPSAALNELLD